ncbi:MAG TPA: glutamate--cysteine ligase, partial [Alphaproteobacteria bacterium]|nr:glutamate--cysteine ligase [Alphaproteobacteria bacterium]
MAGSEQNDTPIDDRRQLIDYLASGCKPKSAWRIGTEHEKFGFRLSNHNPLPYDGPNGIRAMLEGLRQFGWQPIMEGENIIGLSQDGASITLEPGGQFELSGAPLETLHATCAEVNTHLAQVKQIASELDIGFLGLGFSPLWTRAETPVMPKGRYEIMTRYMPKRGTLGLDMMYRSCTVQVNLDFASEADMARKFRVGLALQPIATALFANSPFTEGKPNGYLSFRSHVWTDTDPDRSGMLPFVFEDGFGFERYVDYALDVPMYFVQRDGIYHDASGQSFRDFLDGRLPALPGEKPTMEDWANHLTTIFPEVRIKKFAEMRGADGGPWRRLCALPALWVGLLYDQGALDAAWDLVKDWSAEERQALRDNVPKTALHTDFRGRPIKEIANEVLAIARSGLKSRAALDRNGKDEQHFLDVLQEIAAAGQCPAEE